MRCKACNVNLTDRECSRKSVQLHDYIDLCDKCMADILDDVKYTINQNQSNILEEE